MSRDLKQASNHCFYGIGSPGLKLRSKLQCQTAITTTQSSMIFSGYLLVLSFAHVSRYLRLWKRIIIHRGRSLPHIRNIGSLRAWLRRRWNEQQLPHHTHHSESERMAGCPVRLQSRGALQLREKPELYASTGNNP